MKSKKVLCIQDMSGVGRCSLTVVSPVLSIKGIQCVPMPTAVLSTHYGGFGSVAQQDLTQFCLDSLKEYKRIGVQFDCVLSGFIANKAQAQLIENAFDYSPAALKICDPVMADNGKLYSSISSDIMQAITQLCYKSDIIVPNTTEANILLGNDYSQLVFTRDEAAAMALQLKEKYDCSVVITGAKLDDGSVSCCVAQKYADTAQFVSCNYIPVHFPGTGDLFGATMTAYLLEGKTLSQSVEKACRFVELCVRNTWQEGETDTRYGVELEQNLRYLLD